VEVKQAAISIAWFLAIVAVIVLLSWYYWSNA
jgi:hypothetical protein